VTGTRSLILRILLTVLLVAVGVMVMSIPRIIRTRRLQAPDLNPFTVLEDSGRIAADSRPTDSARVIAALHEVEDPELSFSIVELGLVHSLVVDLRRNVTLRLALTMPECPFARFLAEQALESILAVPGVNRIRVTVDPTLVWDPSRLTGEAKTRYERVFGNDPGNSR
jgi:metal-sulfur cluster biosynthetic enzyme